MRQVKDNSRGDVGEDFEEETQVYITPNLNLSLGQWHLEGQPSNTLENNENLLNYRQLT